MNTAAQIPAVSITINRAEGPHDLCRKPMTFTGDDCWLDAHAWLFSQGKTFPTSGYDKHDFKVVFADGEEYEGRLDCKAPSCEDPDLNVARHMREFIEFYAGVRRPVHFTDEQWTRHMDRTAEDRPNYVAFLAEYAIP
jgi:hypothetical protein